MLVSLGGASRGAGRCRLGHGYGLTQLCDESTSLCKVSRRLPVKPVGRRGRERGGKREKKERNKGAGEED